MIVCRQLGVIFPTVKMMAKYVGCSSRELSRHLNGHKNNIHGLRFVRIK